MSCGRGTAVKPLRHGGFSLSACTCRCWTCPQCAARRRREVRDEIASGTPSTFFTLTWWTARPEAPADARRVMAHGFKNLVLRIRRRWPTCTFEYAVVVELTQRGYPHFHVACRAPYIPQGWLSEAWEALVSAPVVDIEAVRTQEGLAGYLAKYLSKAPAQLGTSKRYWFSQGYRPPLDPEAAKARERFKGWWEPEHIDRVAVALSHSGLIPVWRDEGFALLMPLIIPSYLAPPAPDRLPAPGPGPLDLPRLSALGPLTSAAAPPCWAQPSLL